MSFDIDVLLPTYNRLPSLLITLGGLAAQTYTRFRLIIADQSDEPVMDSIIARSMKHVIEEHGIHVDYHHRYPSKGIAEQRQFLLQAATAPSVLYLDDDVWMEPWVIEKLISVLSEQGCAFVGAFPAGLSHKEDVRKDQQIIDYWIGHVEPEAVWPDTPAWERWQLHRAANLYHVSRQIPKGEYRLYKVAWIASCILYNRKHLEEVGGFSFWERLPRFHSGEEVLVQNLLMRRWGGCALIPSGTYYTEAPSSVLNEQGGVDGHALTLLPEMIDRYTPKSDQTSDNHQAKSETNLADHIVMKGEMKNEAV